MAESTIWEKVIAIGDELQRMGSEAVRKDDAAGLVGAAEASSADPSGINLTELRGILRSRRMRDEFFGEEMFADPAWDILLALLAAELASTEMPVTALCEAAAVPPTTALRWIRQMTEQGLLVRREDPLDKRRTFIELAPQASQTLHRYFKTIAARPI